MIVAPEKNLARVLRALFIAQARDVLQRVRLDGDAPSLSKWGPILADAARPYLEQAWRQGMLQGARRLQSVQQGKTGEAVPLLEHLQPTEQDASAGGPVPTWHPTLRFGAEEARSKSTGRVSVLVVDYRRHGYYRKALRRIHSKALGWGFDLYNPRINDAVDAAVLAFCRSTNETASGSLEEALVKLRAELKEGLSQGEAHTALARRVRTIFADPFRSWRIAVTETSRAVHLGAVMSYKDSGVVEKRRWLASSDACPQCVLPGNLVTAPEPLAASRVSYNGPVIRIHFLRGGYVTVTPNDKFLGAHGFVKASLMVEGDYVFNCRLGQREPPLHPYHHQRPARVEDIFATLQKSSACAGMTVMSVTSEHFHGDGAFCNGEVEIVRTNGFFRGERDMSCGEHFTKQFLQRTLMGFRCLPGQSQLGEGGLFGGFTSNSVMSGLGYPQPFFDGAIAVDEILNLAESSFCDPSFSENPLNNYFANQQFGSDLGYSDSRSVLGDYEVLVNTDLTRSWVSLLKTAGAQPYSCNFEAVGNLGDSEVQSLANLLYGFACQVQPGDLQHDRVLGVEWFHYKGPVYDIQTTSSLYLIGNGVVKSNCLALDGKEVGLEEPYLVKPGGGPYAVVMSPPLHPSCFCDEVPVL